MIAAGAGLVPTPVVGGPCAADNPMVSYYVSATPQSYNSTGTRAFASNNGGTIYQETVGGVAPAEAAFATCDGTGTCSAIQ